MYKLLGIKTTLPWTKEKTEIKYTTQLVSPWARNSTTWPSEPFKSEFTYESISDNFKSIILIYSKIGQQVKF